MQMALDEVAAETAAAGGPRTVRVYQWPDTLSLGYRQATETVDWETCDEIGIEVTRRPTGGGGIYHDRVGDISYSIAVPTAEVPSDLRSCYELLCEPVFGAFSRLGVDATFANEPKAACYQPACYLRDVDPAHDIVVAGRKISGNAQYRQRGAVLQHGSISYALAPERHLSAFNTEVSPAEFRARVSAISEGDCEGTGNYEGTATISRERAVSALEAALSGWADAEEGEWTAAELDRATTLVSEKYGDTAWIQKF